jgi:CheY-like chemotaxis protein
MLTGKRIYIVEDSPMNIVIMQRILEQHGATIFKDEWGFYAVEKVKQLAPIDLILLDLMLPCRMSGYDIFDKLRANAQLASIPIAIVTASDPNLEMTKARDKGFNGFIQKPVDQETFPRMLRAILDGKAVWADDFI